jgi:CheY-like chemotaxis protein
LLAGGIAHDFNNLLVGILGGASYAIEELPPSHPLQPTLCDILRSGERAAFLTRQMLAYAGKGRFFVESVDLNEMVRTTTVLIKASIPKYVEVRFQLRQPLAPVEADSGQMQQIVMNLILNAAEAIQDGKRGTVTIRTDLCDFDAPAISALDLVSGNLLPGPHLVLEVEDTGSGMSEETKANIFDPFFTTKFTGRGLGLSAVHGILRSQKGAIEVRSALGHGSTFRIFLPALPQAVIPREKPRETVSAGKGTILVVDDEEIVRRTARASLEHHGFRAIVAENGEQGISFLRDPEVPVSIVVLDMSMPGMSGRQFMERMGALGIHVPVLICSGHGESEVYREFSGFDIAGVIQKPFTARQLDEGVSNALRPRPVAG